MATAVGATTAREVQQIQSLWGGYGVAVRCALTDGPHDSVVVKHVRPGAGHSRSYNLSHNRSHSRKLRSYDVELAWYRDWAARCGAGCRVPQVLHVERGAGEWLFVLEDLDAAGYPRRAHDLGGKQRTQCLTWLGAFHGAFLGARPRGLWKVGTYWHLATRPDEHQAMPRGPLRDAAAAIDARLSAATFQTLVHGDAKPANFCFGRDGVAAVDFQYVGAGCGVKDVAYLLSDADEGSTQRGLETYFAALRRALPAEVSADAVEAEWRALYPWAWADFHRFLVGWAPGWRVNAYGRRLTQQVLAAV